MPIQAPQWTEFLSCPVCTNEFAPALRSPISLGCGHTVCRTCLNNLHCKQCPFDQSNINTNLEELPVNYALLQLVLSGASGTSGLNDGTIEHDNFVPHNLNPEDCNYYLKSKKCIEELALYLKPFSSGSGSGTTNVLSRPMQRKLVTLINCQLMEAEGRARASRAARSLGERTVMELILQHQNPQQLSANLWAAVRFRGCQFLGPAMQEEVLKLVLLALEDGSALSRKVLVMFVVQRLEPHFPQASKTSIGHVVQLLYRASCFKVSKREGDSSLMQLKEEFRTYDALRREHDAQIVQIATEAGLRIAPDQWSALLYGDTAHKSQMQSIIDKLQSPQSFSQSVKELIIALQRTGDPGKLSDLRSHLELLAEIDPSPDSEPPAWVELWHALDGVRATVAGLVELIQLHGSRKLTDQGGPHGAKYKISMCRDFTLRNSCPRGANCTFAHSEEELDKYRAKNRKATARSLKGSCDPKEEQEEAQAGGDNLIFPDEKLYGSPSSDSSLMRKSFIPLNPTAMSSPGYATRPDIEYSGTFPASRLAAPPSQPPPIQSGVPHLSPSTVVEPPPVSVFQPLQPAMFAQTPTYNQDVYGHRTSPHSSILGLGSMAQPQVDYTSPPPALQLRAATIENVRNSTKTEPNHLHQKQHFQHPRIIPTVTQNKMVSARELFVLQQRKNKIVSQLEKVVGKQKANVISSQVRISQMLNVDGQICAPPSCWGVGGGHVLDGMLDNGMATPPLLTRSSSMQTEDEFIPFDGPVMSKYGPISRTAKSLIQQNSPYNDSAMQMPVAQGTPGLLRRPHPSASPLTPMLLHNMQPYSPSPHIMPAAGPGGSEGYITFSPGLLETPQLILPDDKQQYESHLMQLHMRSLEQELYNTGLDQDGRSMQESEKLTSELYAIEQGIREQLRLSQPVATPDYSSWSMNKNGSFAWNGKPTGDSRLDGEDTYDAMIANHMMEQALRLELDLEEQEKRWCNEDTTKS